MTSNSMGTSEPARCFAISHICTRPPQHGTVIRSWLLELAGNAFAERGQDLADVRGLVSDSGEGRWTVQEAMDLDVPAPVITQSLITRFRSRQDESYTAQVLAALREQFGGHAIKEK